MKFFKSVENKEEKDRLIMEYAPLVKYIAHRIAVKLPPHIEVDDLINTGIIGLIDAAEKYDPDRGIKFKTYAEFRIRGAILDELRAQDWAPRSLRKKVSMVEETFRSLEQKLGRPPSEEEVAKKLEIEVDELKKTIEQSASFALISLDELPGDLSSGKKRSLLALTANSGKNDPFTQLNLNEVRDRISGFIDKLPSQERLVVSLYYYDELTMKEIGKVLSITESRVSQIHSRALIRLRGKMTKPTRQNSYKGLPQFIDNVL